MMPPQVLISGLLLLLPAAWTTTVTSSHQLWNNHTISTKDLYIGTSVSAALLILLAGVLAVLSE